MSEYPAIVIGDGWSAIASTALLLKSGRNVVWVSGHQTRFASPVAGLESGAASEILMKLAEDFSIECGKIKEGVSLRQYRNKAFREPSWFKALEKEARSKLMGDALWTPERRWGESSEVRFELTLSEIEDALREKILADPRVKRVQGVPVKGFVAGEGDAIRMQLASGEEIKGSEVFYSDRWNLLRGFEGLPKAISFLRNRHPVGALQATFFHKVPVGPGVEESFIVPLHRDAGEEMERHIWGYFSSDGKRSIWTLCLAQEELEDNHSIAKKFRRLKTTLDRVFSGSDLIPKGFDTFGSTLSGEQVRFEEEAVFAGGNVLSEPIQVPHLPKFQVLTDAYGPGASLVQVKSAMAPAGHA